MGLAPPGKRLHGDQINDSEEVTLAADRELKHQGGRAEPANDHVNAHVEICTGAVELVDETDTRNAVLIGLAPHGFGLRLNPSNAVKHGDRTIEHAQ
ncbi:unannotated protein [freshwater metagenome]|uniref:Unannotated protein n=1 Tax=freshwater metagenome TaxID=449393 RepID=A0A6J6ZVC5_9ZZZZ